MTPFRVPTGPRTNNRMNPMFQMLMFRLTVVPEQILAAVKKVVAGRVAVQLYSANPPTKLAVVDGFETSVVAFNTDIPYFDLGHGQALLYGPGDIQVRTGPGMSYLPVPRPSLTRSSLHAGCPLRTRANTDTGTARICRMLRISRAAASCGAFGRQVAPRLRRCGEW